MNTMAGTLDAAFGDKMMDGIEEWSGIPDVVRSSFYVLYKTLQKYDKRLTRCEKLAENIPRVECQQENDPCLYIQMHSKEEVQKGIADPCFSIKEELGRKLDIANFFDMFHKQNELMRIEQRNEMNERMQSYFMRSEHLFLKLKSYISRKWRESEELINVNVQEIRKEFDEKSQTGVTQHSNDQGLELGRNHSILERISSIETSMQSLCLLHDTIKATQDKPIVDNSICTHFKNFIHARVAAENEAFSKSLTVLEEQTKAVMHTLQLLESKMAMHEKMAYQHTKAGQSSPRAYHISHTEIIHEMATTTDTLDVATNISPQLTSPDRNTVDLRRKRELSKARFKEIAMRQKTRLQRQLNG